jgi:hypothetical protein
MKLVWVFNRVFNQVFAVVGEFVLAHEQYENGGLPSGEPVRNMAQPTKLEWNLSGLEDFIKVAAERHQQTVSACKLTLLLWMRLDLNFSRTIWTPTWSQCRMVKDT